MQINKQRRQSPPTEILSVSILYYLSAWLSLKFSSESGAIASVWLANGVLLAFLLTTHRSQWRKLVVGCMIANVLADIGAGDDIMKAIMLSACNMAEVAIPAHMLGGILSNTIFRPGDFIGRYGGEEFVIVLPGTDITGAEKVCKRVKEIVSAANLPHETSPLDHVTVSVGFACMTPDHQLDRSQLLEAADAALYSAKSSGRNRIAQPPTGQPPVTKDLKASVQILVAARIS